MEIQHYAKILYHRKVVVLLTAILTVAVVAFGSVQMTPTYSASHLLRVAQPTSDVVSYSDLGYSQRLIETYVRILQSRPFLEEAARRLDLGLPADELADLVKVEAISGTELISISVTHPDPRQAAAIANTLGDLLIEQGQKVYTGEGKDARQILLDQLAAIDAQLSKDRADLALVSPATPASPEASSLAARISAEEQTYSMLLSQYEKARVEAMLRANSISSVEPAVPPVAPSQPNVKLNVVLAGIVGLVGGVGLAFLFEALTPTIYSAEQLARLTSIKLIGRIPKLKVRHLLRVRDRLLAMDPDAAPASEAFRALGASILARHTSPSPRVVLISSAEPEAGKSTVATNLSIALARSGHQVIIVDGDQRRPCLHRVYRVPQAPGLADVLQEHGSADRCLHATSFPGLRVLPAGAAQGDQPLSYHSTVLPDNVNRLSAQADVVIWDSAPVLAAGDTALLAPLADLVLLVVAEDQTTSRQLKLAVEQLQQLGCKELGIVYNKTADTDYGYYQYYRSGLRVRQKQANHRRLPHGPLAPVREEIRG